MIWGLRRGERTRHVLEQLEPSGRLRLHGDYVRVHATSSGGVAVERASGSRDEFDLFVSAMGQDGGWDLPFVSDGNGPPPAGCLGIPAHDLSVVPARFGAPVGVCAADGMIRVLGAAGTRATEVASNRSGVHRPGAYVRALVGADILDAASETPDAAAFQTLAVPSHAPRPAGLLRPDGLALANVGRHPDFEVARLAAYFEEVHMARSRAARSSPEHRRPPRYDRPPREWVTFAQLRAAGLRDDVVRALERFEP